MLQRSSSLEMYILRSPATDCCELCVDAKQSNAMQCSVARKSHACDQQGDEATSGATKM
jgi:hypothetical protein